MFQAPPAICIMAWQGTVPLLLSAFCTDTAVVIPLSSPPPMLSSDNQGIIGCIKSSIHIVSLSRQLPNLCPNPIVTPPTSTDPALVYSCQGPSRQEIGQSTLG